MYDTKDGIQLSMPCCSETRTYQFTRKFIHLVNEVLNFYDVKVLIETVFKP